MCPHVHQRACHKNAHKSIFGNSLPLEAIQVPVNVECVNTLRQLLTMEYYTATRTNKLLIFMSNMAESHKHNIEKKKGKKDYILHDFIYVNTRIRNPGVRNQDGVTLGEEDRERG